MFTTGDKVDQGKFSRDMVGTIVGEYLSIAGKLTSRRWELILALCGEKIGQSNLAVASHSVQVNRRTLYEPSSPMMGSDSQQ
jgi:hypothetical protein